MFFGDLPAAIHPVAPAGERADVDADVASAVARLSPRLRIAVLLRYFDDLSYEEIADVLRVTPGTVASRLSRAHAILARELAHRRPSAAAREEDGDVTQA